MAINKFSDIDNYKRDIIYTSSLRVLIIWGAYIFIIFLMISMITNIEIPVKENSDDTQRFNKITIITYNVVYFIPSIFKFDSSVLTTLVTISLTVFIGLGIIDNRYSNLEMYDESLYLARRIFALWIANGAGILMFSNYIYGLFLFVAGWEDSELSKNILYSRSHIWIFLFLSAFVIIIGNIASEYPKDRQKNTNKILRQLISRERRGAHLDDYCIKDNNKLKEAFFINNIIKIFPKGCFRTILWYFILTAFIQATLVFMFFNWNRDGRIFYGDNLKIIIIFIISLALNTLSYISLGIFGLPSILSEISFRKKYKKTRKVILYIFVTGITGIVAFYYNLLVAATCINSGYTFQSWADKSSTELFVFIYSTPSLAAIIWSLRVYRNDVLNFYREIFEVRDPDGRSINSEDVYHLINIWNLWSKAQKAYRKELFVSNEKYSDLKMLCRYWFIYHDQAEDNKNNNSQKDNNVLIPFRQIENN